MGHLWRPSLGAVHLGFFVIIVLVFCLFVCFETGSFIGLRFSDLGRLAGSKRNASSILIPQRQDF